jgi:CheY-like chemotaxis protein
MRTGLLCARKGDADMTPRDPARSAVLVVDDDQDTRTVVKLILEDQGYHVLEAKDGHNALDQLTDWLPALVLLDLQMPVMDGWRFCAEVERQRLEVPIVIMTAGAQAQPEAERCEVAGYLPKPFDLQHLVTVVGQFARPVT